jgi:hypothetical protein
MRQKIRDTMQDVMDTRAAVQYAVIGRSENYPTLYHMNQTPMNAERLRARREAATGRPCYVVAMPAWDANPLAALTAAEAERTDRKRSWTQPR